MSRRSLLFPIILAVLAGCQDVTSPDGSLRPQFAQGDGGVWTDGPLRQEVEEVKRRLAELRTQEPGAQRDRGP